MLGRWLRNFVFAPDYPSATHLALRAEDGVDIHALLIDGPVGCGVTVMIAPGLGHWARHPKIVEFAHAMAGHANVIVVELRGHGSSGDVSRLGSVEWRDIAAAAAVVPADDTFVLVGISMGSVATTVYAATASTTPGNGPRRPDALVSISGPAWWTWGSPSNGVARALADANWWIMRLGMRWFMHARVGSVDNGSWRDPVAVIGNLADIPIVIVHDRADKYFAAGQVEALALAGGPNTEVWWREGGHATDLLDNQLYDDLARFVASVDGARVPPA